MPKQNVTVGELVEHQIKKWESLYSEKKRKPEAAPPVVTVSMQPGSGGSVIADQVAKRLDYDCFNRNIVEEISKSTKIRSTVINSLEKERRRGVNDFITSLIDDQYIHPDSYLSYLMDIINTIASHGRAVIVGRGANFILPADEIFSVRVIAPLDLRVKRVAMANRVTTKEAKKRVMHRASRRKAFVRQSFHADISDPNNYDMTINTGKVTIEAAVEAIIGAVMQTVVDSKS